MITVNSNSSLTEEYTLQSKKQRTRELFVLHQTGPFRKLSHPSPFSGDHSQVSPRSCPNCPPSLQCRPRTFACRKNLVGTPAMPRRSLLSIRDRYEWRCLRRVLGTHPAASYSALASFRCRWPTVWPRRHTSCRSPVAWLTCLSDRKLEIVGCKEVPWFWGRNLMFLFFWLNWWLFCGKIH